MRLLHSLCRSMHATQVQHSIAHQALIGSVKYCMATKVKLQGPRVPAGRGRSCVV